MDFKQAVQFATQNQPDYALVHDASAAPNTGYRVDGDTLTGIVIEDGKIRETSVSLTVLDAIHADWAVTHMPFSLYPEAPAQGSHLTSGNRQHLCADNQEYTTIGDAPGAKSLAELAGRGAAISGNSSTGRDLSQFTPEESQSMLRRMELRMKEIFAPNATHGGPKGPS
jgi:hypothetical protein